MTEQHDKEEATEIAARRKVNFEVELEKASKVRDAGLIMELHHAYTKAWISEIITDSEYNQLVDALFMRDRAI